MEILKNILAVIGSTIILLALVVLLPFILILALIGSFISKQEQKKFLKQYTLFLAKNEGREIFCYTNRKNSKSIIENFGFQIFYKALC